ncbi:MAG TPA: VOC family protein [Pseudonocardia sp.]|nr:VOC family protein [Pseudonocardia sp.]
MPAERSVPTARHSHVGLVVADLAPAVAFYAELTGARTVHLMEIPEFGIRNVFVSAGPDVFIELIESPSERGLRVLGETYRPGEQILAMETDDLDATIAGLSRRGADVTALPPTATLPFPRGWVSRDGVPRATRGDLPIELLPAGTVAQLVERCEVREPANLTG